MNTFTAAYPTECTRCGTKIRKGDEAAFAAFDEIIHVTCPPDTTTLQRDLCPSCFLELPVTGECSCRE